MTITIDPQTEQLLAERCAPYLAACGASSASQAPCLWRGLSGTNVPTGPTECKTRPARVPRSMPEWLHHRIDQWFDDRHGHPYRSAHVAFCTGDRAQARKYGTAVAIFPIGEFRFAWSPEVLDLTDFTRAFFNAHGVANFHTFNNDSLPVCRSLLDSFAGRYLTNDLVRAIGSHREVMLACDAYFAIPQ